LPRTVRAMTAVGRPRWAELQRWRLAGEPREGAREGAEVVPVHVVDGAPERLELRGEGLEGRQLLGPHVGLERVAIDHQHEVVQPLRTNWRSARPATTYAPRRRARPSAPERAGTGTTAGSGTAT
jgi:hypothetical protein